MRHVFVETNWLVTVAAPARNPTPAALELLDAAKNGDVRIHIPTCCFGEAKKTIRQKFQPKEADKLRGYLQWAVEQKVLDEQAAESTRGVLTSFVGSVTSKLAHLNDTLRDITTTAGIVTVPLDDAILDMSLELHFKEIDLSEFDRAVLAAVLVKGRHLRESGEADVNFCSLDSGLLPWQKRGEPRPELMGLYDDAGVWVYSDFTLTNPERPKSFPQSVRGH